VDRRGEFEWPLSEITPRLNSPSMEFRIRKGPDQARIRHRTTQLCTANQKTSDEEYFTASQVADRLKLHRNTVKHLMRNETSGVIRIGNRRHIERYSAAAVQRLLRRLEQGEDPRFDNEQD